MELTNSKRMMYTANYAITQLAPEEQQKIESKPGAGYPKANLLRSLDLKPQDLDRLEAAMNAEGVPHKESELRNLLVIANNLVFAKQPISMIELAAAMAPISYDIITHFVDLISNIRGISPASKILAYATNQQRKIAPIGRLHLERIEMYPAGVEKGELVFTVPMAPGETVTISHKEWSTSTREFEEIVQDSFESYSEQGVAEKTDASMASDNETKHSSALNFGASLTGSYGSVTLSTTLGIVNTKDERNSVKQSLQKNREVTEKASARTRKEHKVSMRLETKTGTEDRSGKTISNPSKTAIRIDYYRMMRKWRTDLFRYGLRQTYDIAIPLPGVRLWALHQRVAELDKQLHAPLSFPLKPEDINSWNYRQEAIKWGTTVQDPPPETIEDHKYAMTEFLDSNAAADGRFGQIIIDVPPGYYVDTDARLQANFSHWVRINAQDVAFDIIGGIKDSSIPLLSDVVKSTLPSIYGKSGHLAVIYSYRYVSLASIEVSLTYKRSDETLRKWQLDIWSQLHAAALGRHQEEMARLQEERDQLWRLLNGKDTLSLRRLEREELMRLVMQWLLGPSHPVPSVEPVETTVRKLLENERNFQNPKVQVAFAPIQPPDPSPTFTGIDEKAWFEAIAFGEFVKFIHQAVEWENILYFLYPYFWGSETLGRDKLLFEHGDPEHERFLRAGYARVVLTVRPGFEETFTHLIETGTLDEHSESPYIPIAQDISNFARTNYTGIPPANPELHARPLLYPEQRATWDSMQDIMAKIDSFKKKNGYYPAKLDDLPAGLPEGEQPFVIPVDAWGNPFIYKMPGLGADYDLISLGADKEVGGEGLNADISSAAGASLVATWFDYTPTSALDIEVDTKPEDIA